MSEELDPEHLKLVSQTSEPATAPSESRAGTRYMVMSKEEAGCVK